MTRDQAGSANEIALPLIVRVTLCGVTDPGEVDTHVYCVNATPDPFEVAVRSASFTTVDEQLGTVICHGSEPRRVLLASSEVARVGEVRGWEWDGYVGLEVEYTACATGRRERRTYSLKRSTAGYRVPGIETQGSLISPDAKFR